MRFAYCVSAVCVIVAVCMVGSGTGQSNMVVCPLTSDHPLQITATDQPIYIQSQNLSSPTYFPNMDCRIILVARSNRKRIHISVSESFLEEPIFTDCEDYVSVRDGNQPTSKEIVRWCGVERPVGITSSSDSVYLHFHSDGIIQKPGFNISFVDFDMPGCPKDWVVDQENENCYKLFEETQGMSWLDSQKMCNLEKSNLLTIEDTKEYKFIVENFSRAHSFPWIGYYDGNSEGSFEAVDEQPIIWPTTFPSFTHDHNTKDCIFFDWNIKDAIAYQINDCRTRHSYICKKRIDGSSAIYPPPTKAVRRGLETASINYTFWIMVLLIILLLLLIACIIFYRCKKRYQENRIGNIDLNQRLVHGSQSTMAQQSQKDMQNSHTSLKITNETVTNSGMHTNSTLKNAKNDNMYRQKSTEIAGNSTMAKKNYASSSNHKTMATVESIQKQKSQHKSVSDEEENTSPRFEMTPNQPQFLRNTNSPPESSAQHRGVTNAAFEHDHGHGTLSPIQAEHSFTQASPSGAPHPSPVTTLQNETVLSSGSSRPSNYDLLASSGGAGTGARSKREGSRKSNVKSFDRPHVGALDHVSAISLDEFWKQV